MKNLTYYSPLLLSSFRLFFGMFFWPFFVYSYALIPFGEFSKNLVVGLFFIICLTDFFDGFFARRYGCVTQIGALLDHFSDKVLVIATILPLVYIQRIHFFWALVIIMRELYILVLRYAASQFDVRLSVQWYGKLKTWLQCAYLILIFSYFQQCSSYLIIEKILLSIVITVTIVSAVMYTINFMHYKGEMRL